MIQCRFFFCEEKINLILTQDYNLIPKKETYYIFEFLFKIFKPLTYELYLQQKRTNKNITGTDSLSVINYKNKEATKVQYVCKFANLIDAGISSEVLKTPSQF